VADSRRCFRRRWEEESGDRRDAAHPADEYGALADQPVELADFAPFEIAPEAYDADVARLEPFNR
jgi:hypothetical protein